MRSDPDGEMLAPLLPAASGADEEKVRHRCWSNRGEPSASEREAFLIDHGLQTATLLRLSRSRPAKLRLFRLLQREGLTQLQRGDETLPVHS